MYPNLDNDSPYGQPAKEPKTQQPPKPKKNFFSK